MLFGDWQVEVQVISRAALFPGSAAIRPAALGYGLSLSLGADHGAGLFERLRQNRHREGALPPSTGHPDC